MPPSNWQPIETAPKDNKRLLYLARIVDGKIVELDFDGVWEFWQESYEMPHICGYDWLSANGIQEPTHWAYQELPEAHAILTAEAERLEVERRAT